MEEMKTYLSVPLEEIERAKYLGARYDMARRQWFVPDGVDAMRFARWLPREWQRFERKLKQRNL